MLASKLQRNLIKHLHTHFRPPLQSSTGVTASDWGTFSGWGGGAGGWVGWGRGWGAELQRKIAANVNVELRVSELSKSGPESTLSHLSLCLKTDSVPHVPHKQVFDLVWSDPGGWKAPGN